MHWAQLSQHKSSLAHVALGHADYGETLALQRALHAKRCAGECDDVLLTVEHNPVFTLGRSGSRDHILVPPEELKQQGITVHNIERGGDITYHGPGQLVVYPILDLRGYGKDIHHYIWSLEEAIMRTLIDLDIKGDRREGFPGVWVLPRKIASIGVYIRNWVTYHGLALNVDVNQEHFRLINPCGLLVETVSVNDIRDAGVSVSAVGEAVVKHLGILLDRTIVAASLEEVVSP